MATAGSNGMQQARTGMTMLAAGLALGISSLALAAPAPMAGKALPLVPWPAQVTPQPGVLRLADGATLAVPAGDAPARAAATLLAARLAAQHGLPCAWWKATSAPSASCAARWQRRVTKPMRSPWRRAAR
jgi:hexosaminidase